MHRKAYGSYLRHLRHEDQDHDGDLCTPTRGIAGFHFSNCLECMETRTVKRGARPPSFHHRLHVWLCLPTGLDVQPQEGADLLFGQACQHWSWIQECQGRSVSDSEKGLGHAHQCGFRPDREKPTPT